MKAWKVTTYRTDSPIDDVTLVLANTARQAIQKVCSKFRISGIRVERVERMNCNQIVK